MFRRGKSKVSLKDCQVRYMYVCLGVAFCCFLILLRYGWLQLVRGPELMKRSFSMVTNNVVSQHPRGKIVDRDGEELAVSIMTGSLYADPEDMVDKFPDAKNIKTARNVRQIAAHLLAPVLNIKEETLFKKFSVPESRFQWIKRGLEPKEEQQIRKIIKENKLPGLHFEMESKRFYTKKKMAAQVLGFVGLDDKGGSGIEMTLDKELKGRQTRQLQSYDSKQDRIYDEHVKESVEVKLPTVYLTIDSHMQYVLEEAIDQAVRYHNAAGAAAIIMDPYTGEILSMVSRPTFDPNEYDEYPVESWNNKGVSMIYEPGSVFKPIVGCIGMVKGVVSPGAQFYDAGKITVADRTFKNWDGEGAGWITFTDVIKNSVNTGMVQLGQAIGKKTMVEGAKSFGFGKETGVDLPGEEEGLLYTKDMWDPDLASFSIGQGIAVTPLQELRAICAIANGGELVKPYVVKKIVDADGKVIKEGKKEVVRNVITEDVASQMRGMMEKVVSEGGGKKAAIKGYKIAGKTGTAEKLAAGGGYAEGKYIASFVGFVPADKPKYAMLVMIDTPKGDRFYGSQVSAPVFRDVLQQVLVLKGIQPSSQTGLPSLEEMNRLSKTIEAKQKPKPVPKLETLSTGKIKLPSFNGVGIRQATEILEQGKLRIRPYGEGEAYDQKPPAGTEVEPNSVVEIWFR